MDTTSGNNGEGYLRVDDLKWGEYTLTETKAPANYHLPTGSAATHAVSVLPDAKTNTDVEFVKDAGSITNERITVSALPLTGGMTDRQWLFVGGVVGGLAVLLIGAAGVWNGKKRLV